MKYDPKEVNINSLNKFINNNDDFGAPRIKLDDDDRAFVERIMDSVTTGSKGIFVVLHPNKRMQYILLNANRSNAIALLSKVMQDVAQQLESDIE